MVRRSAQLATQAAALVGLVVSIWMVAEYQIAPEVGLCGPGGGCATVRACWLAGRGAASWPVAGVVAFALALAASLWPVGAVRRALPAMGLVAAVTGASLMVLQRAVCHAYCPFCLVADSAGIAFGVAAWVGRADATPAVFPAVRWVAGALVLFVAIGAYGWATTREAPPQQVAVVPEPIAREGRPGVVTIVEFADFECPFCRRQHEELKPVLASYGPRVRFVRRHLPLSMHAHAEDAARAACCAEEQGHADEMADALFHSEDLTPRGCEAAASRLGLDLAAYRACLSSERVSARLEQDRAAANASSVRALPTTFVANDRAEGEVFVGVASTARLRASIDRALGAAAPGARVPHT